MSLSKLKRRIWFDTKFEKSNWNLIKLTSLVVVVLPTKIRVAILASLAFEGRSTASTMKCLLAGFFKRQGVRSKEIHRRIGWKTVHYYSTWKYFCFLSKVKWAFFRRQFNIGHRFIENAKKVTYIYRFVHHSNCHRFKSKTKINSDQNGNFSHLMISFYKRNVCELWRFGRLTAIFTSSM